MNDCLKWSNKHPSSHIVNRLGQAINLLTHRASLANRAAIKSARQPSRQQTRQINQFYDINSQLRAEYYKPVKSTYSQLIVYTIVARVWPNLIHTHPHTAGDMAPCLTTRSA